MSTQTTQPARRSPEQLLATLRREAERTAMRARNGIRLATGRIPEPPRGTTPHDVVWRNGRTELWHYRSDQVRYGPPVLIVYSLANRSYILDLAPGNSFIERLLAAGLDVYMLEWGIPDERDARNTLETYAVEGIGDAIRAIQRDSGQQEVTLFGYCLGGILAMLGLAACPQWPVRSLITATLPLDWDGIDPAMTAIARKGSLRVEDLLDDSGNVPGSLVAQSFNSLVPLGTVTEYADLVEGMWNEDYIRQYQLFAGWGHDHIPLAGATANDLVEKLIRQNNLGTDGTFELGGRQVSLADITVPFRSLVAEDDTVVPNAASEPAIRLVGSKDADEIRVPGGHIGLFVGRGAHKRSIPRVIEFIQSLSEPTGTDNQPDQ